MESYALLVAATLNAGTVLALAALGLLINEKAGVLNLGAEGMMLCAAIAGFAAVIHKGDDQAGAILVECVDRGTRNLLLERATARTRRQLAAVGAPTRAELTAAYADAAARAAVTAIRQGIASCTMPSSASHTISSAPMVPSV